MSDARSSFATAMASLPRIERTPSTDTADEPAHSSAEQAYAALAAELQKSGFDGVALSFSSPRPLLPPSHSRRRCLSRRAAASRLVQRLHPRARPLDRLDGLPAGASLPPPSQPADRLCHSSRVSSRRATALASLGRLQSPPPSRSDCTGVRRAARLGRDDQKHRGVDSENACLARIVMFELA